MLVVAVVVVAVVACPRADPTLPLVSAALRLTHVLYTCRSAHIDHLIDEHVDECV